MLLFLYPQINFNFISNTILRQRYNIIAKIYGITFYRIKAKKNLYVNLSACEQTCNICFADDTNIFILTIHGLYKLEFILNYICLISQYLYEWNYLLFLTVGLAKLCQTKEETNLIDTINLRDFFQIMYSIHRNHLKKITKLVATWIHKYE